MNVCGDGRSGVLQVYVAAAALEQRGLSWIRGSTCHPIETFRSVCAALESAVFREGRSILAVSVNFFACKPFETMNVHVHEV